MTSPRPPLPGPDDGLPPGEDEGWVQLSCEHGKWSRQQTHCAECDVTLVRTLRDIEDRSGLVEVPQEPFGFDRDPPLACAGDCETVGGHYWIETNGGRVCSECHVFFGDSVDLPADAGERELALEDAVILARKEAAHAAMMAITGAGAIAQPEQAKPEITAVMVNRALECLRVKYPGVYQAMKSDDPSRSVRIVVAEILKAGIG